MMTAAWARGRRSPRPDEESLHAPQGEGVAPHEVFVGELEVGEAVEEGAEGVDPLGPGQGGAHAVVGPLPEGDVGPVGVELVVPRASFEDRLSELLDRVARAPREALVGINAALEAARPAARPELAGLATASFAVTWVADAHWEAVEEMGRRRKAAAAARAGTA